MQQFTLGVSYLKRGFKLLGAPRLRLLVLIPALINLVVAILLIRVLFHEFSSMAHWLDQLLPTWLHWLDWLIWLCYTLSLAFFFVYVFNTIANIVSAPFNGYLSEAVQRQQGLPISNQKSLSSAMLSALKRQFHIVVHCIILSIACLILFFIPIINIFAPFVWFLLSAWIMALQYTDYAFDNNNIDFKTMRKRLRSKGFLSTSFGALVVLLSMIPIVNLLIVPAAVIGATLMYTEQFHEKH
jgi:CysZ protein